MKCLVKSEPEEDFLNEKRENRRWANQKSDSNVENNNLSEYIFCNY